MKRRRAESVNDVEFVPFSIEAGGVWGPAAKKFFSQFSLRLNFVPSPNFLHAKRHHTKSSVMTLAQAPAYNPPPAILAVKWQGTLRSLGRHCHDQAH